METMTESIRKNAGMTIFFGILLILGGAFAMYSPFVAGLSIALMLGWLFVVGGIFKLIFAFAAKAGLGAIVWAILTIAAGGYMVSNPEVAMATLVIVVSVFLLLSGIAEFMLALAAKPAPGWGWAIVSGILSIVLAVLMWSQFPLAGTMALGIILGIKMLFSGMTLLMLGITVRKATKNVVAAD